MKKIASTLIATIPCLAMAQTYDYTISVTPLFWQAHEEGLEYVIGNETGVGFIDDNGSVKRICSDWDWGVRAEVGYNTDCLMDFAANWTYYSTTGTGSATGTFPSALFTIWTTPGTAFTPSTEASARWRLHLNILDVEMSSLFQPNCFLTLRPFVALSTNWIDQKFHINTSGGTTTGGAAFTILDDDIDMKNDFWGIGPKFGLDTTWYLGCGFSFFASGDIAILYGKFDISQHEVVDIAENTPPVVYLDIPKDKYWLSRVNLDFIMGFQWERCFNEGCHRLSFQAGWENLYFFGQNQLKRFVDDINPGIFLAVKGDLTIQGLTARVKFDF